MISPAKLPLYFNCFFFDKENKKAVFTYRIDGTQNQQYPFQLSKRGGDGPLGWQNLSIYASVHDSVGILLKELFSEELSDEVYHGQASIDPAVILEKITHGERIISIYDETDNEAFRLEYDVAFEDLIQRSVSS